MKHPHRARLSEKVSDIRQKHIVSALKVLYLLSFNHNYTQINRESVTNIPNQNKTSKQWQYKMVIVDEKNIAKTQATASKAMKKEKKTKLTKK